MSGETPQGVHVRQPWTDTRSEIALVSSGQRLTCDLNHNKPYNSSEDKSKTYALPTNCCGVSRIQSQLAEKDVLMSTG